MFSPGRPGENGNGKALRETCLEGLFHVWLRTVVRVVSAEPPYHEGTVFLEHQGHGLTC